MRYSVTARWKDRTDGRRYVPGDVIECSPARAERLRQKRLVGRALSAPVVSVEQYHTGGGYYVLPDGSKHRGRAAAEQALRGETE